MLTTIVLSVVIIISIAINIKQYKYIKRLEQKLYNLIKIKDK